MPDFSPPRWTPTPDQIAFLQTVDSPTIANAIETFELRDRTVGFIGGTIRPLVSQPGVMVGQALTVTMTNAAGPPADRAAYWRMWEALSAIPAPSVLVIQDVSGTPTRCAYAGEVMATLAQRLGAVGMVTDGGFRDIAEVEALGMHYYAPFPVVSHGNFSVVDVGISITLDGETIEAGDLLHGDSNGIVVVPPESLDGLSDAVAAIRDRERRFMHFLRGDSFTLEAARAGTGY